MHIFLAVTNFGCASYTIIISNTVFINVLDSPGLEPHVIFMSTLTPGAPLSLYMIAKVEMTSTSVAVIPPCSVPPRLVCSSSTRISHTTLPGLADKTST